MFDREDIFYLMLKRLSGLRFKNPGSAITGQPGGQSNGPLSGLHAGGSFHDYLYAGAGSLASEFTHALIGACAY